MLNVFMCVLDIIFNTIFIFPTREVSFLGMSFTMYGAGMEVAGAALGTALAIAVTSLLMSSYLCFKSKELSLVQDKARLRMQGSTLKKAFQIGAPIGLEHTIMCGAQIASTVIVAPLGNIAIAANAFAARFYLYYQKWDEAIACATAALSETPSSTLRNYEELLEYPMNNGSTQNTAATYYIGTELPCNYLLATAYSSSGTYFGGYSTGLQYNHGQYIAKNEGISATNMPFAPYTWKCRPLSLSYAICTRPPSSGRIITLMYSFSK